MTDLSASVSLVTSIAAQMSVARASDWPLTVIIAFSLAIHWLARVSVKDVPSPLDQMLARCSCVPTPLAKITPSGAMSQAIDIQLFLPAPELQHSRSHKVKEMFDSTRRGSVCLTKYA